MWAPKQKTWNSKLCGPFKCRITRSCRSDIIGETTEPDRRKIYMKLNHKHTYRFSARYCSHVKLTFLQQSWRRLQVFWDIIPWQLLVTEFSELLATSVFRDQWKNRTLKMEAARNILIDMTSYSTRPKCVVNILTISLCDCLSCRLRNACEGHCSGVNIPTL